MFKAEGVVSVQIFATVSKLSTHTGLRASKVCVRLGAGMSKTSCTLSVEIFATVSEMSTHTHCGQGNKACVRLAFLSRLSEQSPSLHSTRRSCTVPDDPHTSRSLLNKHCSEEAQRHRASRR